MQNQTTTADKLHKASVTTRIPWALQLTAAFLLGAVVLYGAAFVQTSVVHNAAHDMRHSQGFPCH